MKKYVILTLLFICGIFIMLSEFKPKDHITFGTPGLPFSSDPMDYDNYVHHYAFTSVMAKLVSLNKNGEVVPVIAKRWSNSDDFRTWTFEIRTDLTYSNNEILRIEDVEKNFRRLAFLKKKQNSESGVLEFIVGFDKFNSIDAPLSGISINGNNITFKFVKSIPNLLEKISFGFYGIAHPSLYDKRTGVWINKKMVISSGAYAVSKWTSSDFELSLRPNLPFNDSEKSIQKVIFKEIKLIKSSEDLKNVDVLIADQKSLLVDDSFVFNGSTRGLKIGYVECYSWNKDHSPFNRVEVRRWFRNKFYEGLQSSGFQATKSFFPLALNGVSEIVDLENYEKPNFKGFDIITGSLPKTAKLRENDNKKSLFEIFELALKNLPGESNSNVKFIDFSEESDQEYDLLINGTGIEAENFWETVRFMFNSKQGIQLPDADGTIHQELKKSSPNIQYINQRLWDQAIIWPIRHYSTGFWFNKKSNIDYSEMNFDAPSIDFQFLKWK